jgi:hypothetical protein
MSKIKRMVCSKCLSAKCDGVIWKGEYGKLCTSELQNSDNYFDYRKVGKHWECHIVIGHGDDWWEKMQRVK